MDVFPILLVIHILLAVSLIGVILLQRSEGGALGIGGSSGGGLMSGRAAGSLLTRMTAIFASLFFVTSMSLALIANSRSTAQSPFEAIGAQAPQPDASKAEVPAAPAAPSAPIAR
jgi:preprotein translocase subunit SecG